MFDVCVSIVSHEHDDLLPFLLDKISEFNEVKMVVLTHNLPKKDKAIFGVYHYELVEIYNATPYGFSTNHNNAFKFSENTFFCILNPDVIFSINPFPRLLDAFRNHGIGVVAPLVVNSHGVVEDSARYFPTPLRLLKKVFLKDKGAFEIDIRSDCQYVDWLAGMFLLLPSSHFARIGGLDESYFLYYEDVDFSMRIWKSGFKVCLIPNASIIHDGRRDSHFRFKYMLFHFSSMMKFFIKHLFRFPNIRH